MQCWIWKTTFKWKSGIFHKVIYIHIYTKCRISNELNLPLLPSIIFTPAGKVTPPTYLMNTNQDDSRWITNRKGRAAIGISPQRKGRFNWIKKYLFSWTKIIIFLFLKQLFSIYYVYINQNLSKLIVFQLKRPFLWGEIPIAARPFLLVIHRESSWFVFIR